MTGSKDPNIAAHVVLRVDASRAIGMGHLMRMRDLAAEFAARGATCSYACRLESHSVLRAQGIPAASIITVADGSNWTAPSGTTHIVTDIMWSGNAFSAAREVSALTATGLPVTVIDSMPPDHFVTPDSAIPPACVVTPYLGAQHLRPPPRTPDWAAGADFAVMDPAYTAARARIAPPLPHRILVFCGGADPTGLSQRVAARLAPTGAAIDLVLGPLYPPDLRTALTRLANDHLNLTLHGPQSGLSGLIECCGLVVGRIGLLRYQAAMLGRTGIYLFEGPEYRVYLENFDRSGLAEVYFSDPPTGDGPFLERLSSLSDPKIRDALFALNSPAMAAVHGQGAANVVDRVLAQDRRSP